VAVAVALVIPGCASSPSTFSQKRSTDSPFREKVVGMAAADAGAAVVPPAAEAPPPPPIEVWPELDPGWQRRKGEAALARVNFPWRDLGFRIEFLPARAGYRAGMFPHENVIEVYVRPNLTVSETAYDIAHELGHAFDWRYNDATERAAFAAARGYAGRPTWFACSGCTDFETPAGDFAETFAYTVVGPVMFRSRLAPAPDAVELATLRPFFAL
jgi:hypothetical protein